MQSDLPANRRSLFLLGRAHVEWGYGSGDGRLKCCSDGWVSGRCQGRGGLRERHSQAHPSTPILMAESREGRAGPSLQQGWGGAGDRSSVRIPESQLLNNADPPLRGGARAGWLGLCPCELAAALWRTAGAFEASAKPLGQGRSIAGSRSRLNQKARRELAPLTGSVTSASRCTPVKAGGPATQTLWLLMERK